MIDVYEWKSQKEKKYYFGRVRDNRKIYWNNSLQGNDNQGSLV